MFSFAASLPLWLDARGHLPVNVKVIIEGEEEVGSKNLDQFVLANKPLLSGTAQAQLRPAPETSAAVMMQNVPWKAKKTRCGTVISPSGSKPTSFISA